ncbi:uncharacterized protein P884DRAFT_265263 [Thermothelomyces heterothallicus CBS 202.75]|uniref:uncharacterized protein n=1 Tax=Thermothelomyces heterothallicus CBS 202.75 TaxID=1149848 RepID=UPI0037447918
MDLDVPVDAPMSYATSPGLDLYSPYTPQQSQLLMALARLSAASQSQMLTLPPSTVRPSQVSLPPNAALDTPDGFAPEAPNAANAAPPADAPLESFARIEFADSVFQMTTYAVIIGRDQRALDQARRDERRLEEYQRKVREHEERGLPAPSPPTQDRGKFSKSYVSEEGGMLGPESDGDENPRPVKRRKTSGGAGSAVGDSHPAEPAAGELAGSEDKNPTLNRQYVSHTPGAAAVNLSALRPSPHYVPFIGIHSPGPNIASRTKAISREHLKIQFNQKAGVFEAIPLHKNGFFCEDVHYRDEKVVLKSGDRLQIKDVDFVFIINGVPHGKTGAEENLEEEGGSSSRRYSEGGKEMSFDFESSHDPERRSTSPEEVPAAPAKEDSDSELSEPPAEDVPEPGPEKAPEQEVMETIEKDPETPAPNIKPEMSLELLASLDPPIPKKRGPGRPPKNGIMSKREERLRKKAAMELAKKNMPQPPPGDPPVKRKVGRPRKHPLPENAPDRPEKRKYKPRKSKNGEEGEGSDVEKSVKERRREKPKTPPLELNREDYTEEQLQKPPKNYGMLIDEVLSAAPDGLTLKQIYKRIQMKYPFYYFTVDTKGWESSVRHNLIGNDAFRKNEETHLWSRVPGIDIDAGKKRTKATSPDHHHSTNMHTFGQHYNANSAAQGQQQMFQAETGMQQQGYRAAAAAAASPQRPGYAPGNGQGSMGQQHAQPQPGAQAAGAAAQQGPRQPYSVSGQVQGTAAPTPAGPGNQATAAQQPQGNAQTTAYSSPYAARPPPAASAQPGAPPQGVARQGPPPGQSARPYNGLPRTTAPYAQNPPAGTRPAQPATTNANSAPLKPAVAPELVRHITNFKTTVTEQLKKRTPAAEAIAMSVINRGLGLATESTIPEEEGLEKIVLGVFESSRQNLGVNQSLHPGLVQALNNFKGNMIKTLEPKMGKLNAERLILSAIDRVLGFADRSTMPGPDTEKKQYDEAENVLIVAIQRVVTEHQRTQAAVASASASQPASRPGPAPAPTAPGSTQTSVKGHSSATPNPTVSGQYSATAPQGQGAKPSTPLPAYPAPGPAPGPARPSAPAPSAPANSKPTVTSAPPPTQQVPRPATASAPAPQASATPPPTQIQSQAARPSGSVQGPVPAPGQHPAPGTTAAGSQVARPPQHPAPAGAAAPLPAHVSGPGPSQPQSPAHALAQAQAQAAAQNAQAQRPTHVPGSGAAPAPTAAQGPGQPAPQTAHASSAVPNTAAFASSPALSQRQTQQAPPVKPQAPAPAPAPAMTPAAHQPGQGAPKLPSMGSTPVNGPAPAPVPTTTAPPASTAVQAQMETPPAAPSPKPPEPVTAAAAVTAQEKVPHAVDPPLQAPAPGSSQPAAAASPHPTTKQGVQPATSSATSQTLSQSPTPPPGASPSATTVTSNQGGSQAAPKAQAPTPMPAAQSQTPAPAASTTNEAVATTSSSTTITSPTTTTTATTTTTTTTNPPPVTAPPPTPPATAVPAAR